jgi:hypothetical protein
MESKASEAGAVPAGGRMDTVLLASPRSFCAGERRTASETVHLTLPAAVRRS